MGKMRLIKRKELERGSATIEAVIAFTGFIFVIATILNVANYCRAQMVVSNAVDMAAKELSQYSYFYNMSGMEKFNAYVTANSATGAANINDVVDGVSSVYTTMATSLGDSTELGFRLDDKIEDQTLNVTDIQTALQTTNANATNILTSINRMETALDSVGSNPLLYMKSIAAVAGGESFELAKSYAIAAPLGKLLAKSHFDTGDLTVDEYLKNLGIVDGIDGLNFNASTIFSPDEPDCIHLRCYYKIGLGNFFDKAIVELPICKEAVCRAWLGGDDNPVKVTSSAVPTASHSPAQPDVSGNEGPGGQGGGTPVDNEVCENPNIEIPASEEDLLGEALVAYNTAYMREYARQKNEEGGVDAMEAHQIRLSCIYYGVDFDTIGLKDSDGYVWTEDHIQYAIANPTDRYKVIRESECTKEELEAYLNKITWLTKDKIELFEETGKWPDGVQIPKGMYALKADGEVDWDKAPNNGYETLNGVVQKSPYIPAAGEVIDRYGSPKGYYTSPIVDGVVYDYNQRSLPYVQDEEQYHKYKVIADWSELDEKIKKCEDEKLIDEIKERIDEKYGGSLANAIIYQGKVAEVPGWGGGGAVQYEFPFTIEQLVKLGMLEIIP